MRYALLLFFMFLAACATPQVIQPTPETATSTFIPSSTSTSTMIASLTASPQPRFSPITYGPELEDFPANVNPLTGLEVSDPSLLKLPAVLMSISNMPFTARPQAGPGFASWVYELYIGEGATRFMNIFYGEYPRSIPNIHGGCEVRKEIIHPSENWIGNRVWLDENTNGQQDAWEAGIGGVCVHLLDAKRREVLQETATDSNGYYAFDSSGTETIVQFEAPGYYQFTKQDMGDDDRDSDVDINGETKIFRADATAPNWDAGLILTEDVSTTPDPAATSTPWYIPTEDYVG